MISVMIESMPLVEKDAELADFEQNEKKIAEEEAAKLVAKDAEEKAKWAPTLNENGASEAEEERVRLCQTNVFSLEPRLFLSFLSLSCYLEPFHALLGF